MLNILNIDICSICFHSMDNVVTWATALHTARATLMRATAAVPAGVQCLQHDGASVACKKALVKLTTPMIASNLFGDRPKPTATPPMDGLDEVTYGYVPKSRSSMVALAPSMSILLPLS